MSKETIHEKALLAAKGLGKSESHLLDALVLVEVQRVFIKMGYPSLFRYCFLVS